MNIKKSTSVLLIVFTNFCFTKDVTHTKVLVIGSGPSGMSAGVYLARAKIDHAIISGTTPSALTKASKIENWPGTISTTGAQLHSNLKKHCDKLNSNFIEGDVIDVNFDVDPFVVTYKDKEENEKEVTSESVIIATGTSPKKLNIPGETEFVGKGIALCATCDGPFAKDKHAVVIGGGYEALREIGIIKKYAKKITVINKGKALCGPKMLMNFATESPNITVLNDYQPIQFLGDENKLNSVVIQNVKTKEEKNLEADIVFIAIGWKPNTELFEKKLKLDKKGQIRVDDTKTSIPGVFACGDCSSESYHQVPIASSQGYQAAMEAEKHVFNHNDKNCQRKTTDILNDNQELEKIKTT